MVTFTISVLDVFLQVFSKKPIWYFNVPWLLSQQFTCIDFKPVAFLVYDKMNWRLFYFHVTNNGKSIEFTVFTFSKIIFIHKLTFRRNSNVIYLKICLIKNLQSLGVTTVDSRLFNFSNSLSWIKTNFFARAWY